MPEFYTVKLGDTLVSIAHAKGFRSWETIYNHAKNAGLQESHSTPGELFVGDQIYIPDKQAKSVECETGKKQTFIAKSLKAWIRLVLEDEAGQPYARKKYRIVASGKTFDGLTGEDGAVNQAVPPQTRQAELTLWPDETTPQKTLVWSFNLGAVEQA